VPVSGSFPCSFPFIIHLFVTYSMLEHFLCLCLSCLLYHFYYHFYLPQILSLFFFPLWRYWFELRASCLLGWCSTTWTMPPVSKLLYWPLTIIPFLFLLHEWNKFSPSPTDSKLQIFCFWKKISPCVFTVSFVPWLLLFWSVFRVAGFLQMFHRLCLPIYI
jgi:hypothetical protein